MQGPKPSSATQESGRALCESVDCIVSALQEGHHPFALHKPFTCEPSKLEMVASQRHTPPEREQQAEVHCGAMTEEDCWDVC